MSARVAPILFSLAVVALAAVLMVPNLVAQETGPPPPPPPPGEDGPPPPDDEETRERVEERIRIMRAWRLTEALELEEDVALQLFTLLDDFDTRMAPEQAALGESGQQLRSMLDEGSGTDEEIAALLAGIMETHLRLEQLRIDLIASSGAFLSPRQQAALMLFLPDFDRQIREMVRDTRRQRRRVREHRDGPPDGIRGPGPDGERGPPPGNRGGNRDGRRQRRQQVLEGWETLGE